MVDLIISTVMFFFSPFGVTASNMQCKPRNNVIFDTVFSGCENDNNSQDVVVITLYIIFL